MALDKVKELFPEAEVDRRLVSGLLCGSAAAILMFKWMNQIRVQKKLDEFKTKREHGFQRMEKAAKQFKQQVLWHLITFFKNQMSFFLILENDRDRFTCKNISLAHNL